VCVVALHTAVVPPVHAPFAPLPPQPAHELPKYSVLAPVHTSGHGCATDPQPATASHVAVQHTFDDPTAHVVDVAPHEHALQPPDPSHQLVHDAG
jgi:hypothetical protein